MTSYFHTGDRIVRYNKDKIPYIENQNQNTNTLSRDKKQFNYVIPYNYQQQRKLFVLKMNEWLHSYNQLITYDDILQDHSLYWKHKSKNVMNDCHNIRNAECNNNDCDEQMDNIPLHKNVYYLEKIIKSIYRLLQKYNYKIEDGDAFKEDIVYFLYSIS